MRTTIEVPAATAMSTFSFTCSSMARFNDSSTRVKSSSFRVKRLPVKLSPTGRCDNHKERSKHALYFGCIALRIRM
eukprot:Skav208445  [mRNA]  locus=scaffold1952:281379:284337:+ [translate_table: standard]